MTTAKPTYNAAFLYQELVSRLDTRPAEVVQRVTAHIKARTGHATLPSFHQNGATEEEKIALYRELILAVVKNDYSKLIAEPKEPAAPIVVEPEPTAEPEPEPAPPPVEPPAPVEDPKPAPPVQQPPMEDPLNAKLAALTAALASLVETAPVHPAQPTAALTTDQIHAIVADEVKRQTLTMKYELLRVMEYAYQDNKTKLANAIYDAIEES